MAHRFAYAGSLLLGCLAALGCATTPLGAPPAELARGRDQFLQGATVFSNECVTCHGAHGEGLASAPPILGAGALPEYPRTTGASATRRSPTRS